MEQRLQVRVSTDERAGKDRDVNTKRNSTNCVWEMEGEKG